MLMTSRLFPQILILILLLPFTSPGQTPEEDWLALFNGKDLKQWDMKFTGYDLNHNLNETFRVEDGLLKVAYDGYSSFNNEFGHLFYRTPFALSSH